MISPQTTASHPHYNVWVGANAGTGKTKVLTDRVLRLLLQGEHPSSIICLTFTKAAANEMQHRINGHVSRWAVIKEEELTPLLEALTGEVPDDATIARARRLFLQLLDLPSGLSIQTIHAFCQTLLSRFPLEAGIAPQTELLDDHAAYDILLQAKHRLLEDDNAAIKEAVSYLSGRMAEGQFGALLSYMINARSLITAHPTQRNHFTAPDEEAVITQLCEHAPFALLSALAEHLPEGTVTDQKGAEKLTNWLILSPEERKVSYLEYALFFLTQKWEPRQRIATKKVVAALARKNFEEEIAEEQQRIMALLDKLADARVAKDTAAFLTIAEGLFAHYAAIKDETHVLDYHDLITVTRQLLTREDIAPWVLYKLDHGISHLLVDEAQDTSPEQWELIDLLASEFFASQTPREHPRTLFVVGDEKQSIYSFQGADPKGFHRMREKFSRQILEAEHHWQSIALERSFRSTKAVLGVVDHVFAQHPLHHAISASGTPVKHDVFRSGHAGEVELWPLMERAEKDERTPWELPIVQKTARDPDAELARQIAARIRFWLEDGTMLEAKNRSIRPGDIMILLQSRRGLMEKLVRALKEAEIPVAGIDRLRLNDHIAVMDLLALAKFLLLPDDDLNLATLLKTPLLGLRDDDLFTLCYDRGKQSLWQRLKHHADYTAQAHYLTQLLNETDYLTPFALFSGVLYRQGGLKQMRARLGDEMIEPVEEFLSLALAYEEQHTASLEGFVLWMEAQSIEIKRDMEAQHNAVRVMTVHGSKGLQAPIVILPDGMLTPRAKTPEAVKDDKGLLFCANSNDRSLRYRAAYEAKREAEWEEYYRLLYVALTRAEDNLYIAGYKPAQFSEKSWYHLLEQSLSALGDAFIYDEDQGSTAYRYACEQEVDIPPAQADETKAPSEPLPDLYHRPMAAEPARLIPLSPSHMTDNDAPALSPLLHSSEYYLRGKLIHSLLQYLPDMPEPERLPLMTRYLAPYQKQIDTASIAEKLTDIFTRYPEFFGAHSRAEVPIIGTVNGMPISGQIDRLVIEAARVLIIDYKTQSKPPKNPEAIPAAYRRQMELYRALLAKIYPEKQIECFLLWTENGEVMALESAPVPLPVVA